MLMACTCCDSNQSMALTIHSAVVSVLYLSRCLKAATENSFAEIRLARIAHQQAGNGGAVIGFCPLDTLAQHRMLYDGLRLQCRVVFVYAGVDQADAQAPAAAPAITLPVHQAFRTAAAAVITQQAVAVVHVHPHAGIGLAYVAGDLLHVTAGGYPEGTDHQAETFQYAATFGAHAVTVQLLGELPGRVHIGTDHYQLVGFGVFCNERLLLLLHRQVGRRRWQLVID